MAREPLDEKALDQEAYAQAEEHFRLVSSHLPKDAVESVAREVVRRLAFRMPRSVAPDHLPTEDEIERLCVALLSRDEVAGDRIILAARRDGVPMEVIHLGYVAGAARRLGEMWDEDRVTFLEVTLASGRLYRILRGLRYVITGLNMAEVEPNHVLFALVPGETHTLGIEIAADLFRRAGWDVEVAVGADHDEIVAATENRRHNAVVLVSQTDRTVTELVALVLAIRITQPFARIVLAGNVLDHVKDIHRIVGADAVINNLEHAVEDLQAIIEGREVGNTQG